MPECNGGNHWGRGCEVCRGWPPSGRFLLFVVALIIAAVFGAR